MEPANGSKKTDFEIERDRLLAKLKEGELAVLNGKNIRQHEARREMSRWIRK
jgi:hypothetical protein